MDTIEALVPTLEGKTDRQKNPHPVKSLARATWVVARLGGWNCYYKPPGPITFRRGMERFHAIHHGRMLEMRLQRGENPLVLLRHMCRRSPVARPMPQHGHRGRRSTNAAVSRRLSVAMELGMCRSGRSGGACGLATGGNDNRFGCSLVPAS